MADKVKNAFTAQGTASGTIDALGKELVNSAFGAISPLNKYAKYMTGSRVILKCNDQLLGFAFAVKYNISTSNTEIQTIDSWVPWELAPQTVNVSGTMSLFHVPGKSVDQQLLQANLFSFMMHKYITIEISDRTTGNVIFKTTKAVITGKSQTLMAGELSTVELSWKAIGWSDELIPKFPTENGENPKDPNAGLAGIASSAFNAAKKLF